MATTYYFLAAPDEGGVLEWFKSQADVPEEHTNDVRTLLFYRQFGSLHHDLNGEVDASKSPLVSIDPPKVRRGVLWTVGEVHFLTTNMADAFPELERMRRKFQTWLKQFPVVWERQRGGEEGYGYYLEGGSKNVADRIFGLPLGLAAFEAGQDFVADHDNEHRLDSLCKVLRLRGVNCT
jgi:hypothetical protein